VVSIITMGMQHGPIVTRREAGEGVGDAIRRHVQGLSDRILSGDQLTTTWQIPGGQKSLTTIRRVGETDEAVRERHLQAFPGLEISPEIRRAPI
jgi:hypothetical protein